MKLKQIIIYLILLQNYALSFDMQEWKKIIHFTNKPQIVSKYFYLSKYPNITPILELNKTITLLRSKKIGKYTACNYPLRYTFLKSQKIDIPNYDLHQCKDLQSYIKNFQKDELYIAFSDEYINSPASAFGHVMLLFKNKNTPIEIADIIHFAAVAPHDSFLKYNYNGLTGGYKGYYVHEKFFNKIYEYNINEQRNIYLYKLNYSKEEILKIIYHLYELRKSAFKYYFLNTNCASSTAKLLYIPKRKYFKNRAIYTPIDVLKDFQKDIVKKRTYYSLISKINYLYSLLSKEDKRKFKFIIDKNIDVKNSETDELKEILYNYYQFYFRKYHISFENYNDIKKLNFKKTQIKENFNNLFNKKTSFVSIKRHTGNQKKKILVTYRPLYEELSDFQTDKLGNKEFALFKTELSLEKNDIALNSFTLLSIKSYAYRFLYYKPISWEVSSEYNRKNIDNRLKLQNEFGLGLSYEIFDDFHFSLMCDIGIENTNIYFKPHLYFEKSFKSNIKLEAISGINMFKNTNRNFYENQFKLSIKKQNLVYMLNCLITKKEDSIEFGIKYYFDTF